jgi:recombination protein RecA
VLRATDLLLESGGFGLIALDLADVPAQAARRIPLTTWFRFRRAIEHTPTVLLVIEEQPIAGSCSSLLLRLQAPEQKDSSAQATHTNLLTGMNIRVEAVRSPLHSRGERKPVQSATQFSSRSAWTG